MHILFHTNSTVVQASGIESFDIMCVIIQKKYERNSSKNKTITR